MRRKAGLAVVGLVALSALAYAPAWYTHSRLRRDVYWHNVRSGLTTLDADEYREITTPPEGGDAATTTVTVAGLALGLPLEGVQSVKVAGDATTRLVTMYAGRDTLFVLKLKEGALSPAHLGPTLGSLKKIAAAPPPSYFWPIVPSAIADSYYAYSLKTSILGKNRRFFKNGPVDGVLGDPYVVTFLAEGALLRVSGAGERAMLTIARAARPAKGGQRQGGPPPQVAGCVECAIDELGDCKAACAGLLKD